MENSLLTLLREFRDRKASDPRDKVFALLSLALFQKRPPIIPDYSMNESEVFRLVTREIIYDTESLSVLSTELGRKFRNDLPSWVPDWGASGGYTYNIRAEAVELYKACPNTSATPRTVWEGTHGKLHVQGKRIGHLTYSGVPMWGDDARTCRDTLDAWLTIISQETNLDVNPLMFGKIVCAEFMYKPLEKFKVNRMLPEDVIAFLIWAKYSVRSPLAYFHSYRRSNLPFYRAARAWNNVFDLWPNDGVLSSMNCTSESDWYEDCLAPYEFSSSPTEQVQKIKELLEFVASDDISEFKIFDDDGNVRHDAPWKNLLIRLRQRLMETYDFSNDFVFQARESILSNLDMLMMAATVSRCLIISHYALVGLGPANVAVDDEVFLLRGGKTPFILRKVLNSPYYEIVGDCYIQGLMDGEGRRGLGPEDDWKMITLV